MRELTGMEIDWVTGGTGVCTAEDSGGNDYLGGASPNEVGQALVDVYEGLVEATSHIIERVAEAL